MELKDAYFFKPDVVLFCCDWSETAIDEAKEFCKLNKLTPDDVRIVKTFKENSKELHLVLVKVK